jgi:uncharacterized protein (DUF2235 family)
MPKRLVVCSDGTWNKPDQQQDGVLSPTNVTKLALAVADQDAGGNPQLMFYDKGVGTSWYSKIIGGAFGAGLSKNIQDAYKFLVANYAPGDFLYLCGFSRGAYTVRSLAGLIRNSGLLRREFAGKVEDAYQLYRRRDDKSHPTDTEATLFRRSFAYEMRIHFIGVWDTVGALGIPLEGPLRWINKAWQFHDVKLSRSVDHAYHALAIDEKRKAFAPTLWEKQPPLPGQPEQVLEQVWFAGAHSNVGGGYARHGLSDLALLWMMRKAEGCGLRFDLARIPENIRPNPAATATPELPEKSQTWFYKLIGFGDYLRPIGKDDDGKSRNPGVDKKGQPFTCNESAAKSAADKLNAANSSYSAPNLRAFLSAKGSISP